MVRTVAVNAPASICFDVGALREENCPDLCAEACHALLSAADVLALARRLLQMASLQRLGRWGGLRHAPVSTIFHGCFGTWSQAQFQDQQDQLAMTFWQVQVRDSPVPGTKALYS